MDLQDKKTEILKAARECFAHYGYDKTTLDDIGRHVGLNKTSLYYYYKSKELIFSDVILFEINEFLTIIFEKVSTIEGCRDKILTYLIERFKCSQNSLNIDKLAIENIRSNRPLLSELCEKVMEKDVEYLSEIIESYVKSGEILSCDAGRVARSIITIASAIESKTKGCVERKFSSNIDYSAMEDEIVFTVSLILDGLMKK